MFEPPTRSASTASDAPARINVHTFDLDAPNLDAPDLDQRFAMLSADEHARAQRFRFELDRMRYQRGRAMLRTLLSEYIHVAPRSIRFEYGPQAKPYVSDPACFFNLAHSNSLAVLAVSDRELGIDVEVHRDGFANDTIAERFFAPIEVTQLRALPFLEQEAAFFRCWTRKEAYLKARGGGLSIPLDDFTVDFCANGVPRITWVRDDPQEPAQWSVIDCSPEVGQDATCAIAIRGNVDTVTVNRR